MNGSEIIKEVLVNLGIKEPTFSSNIGLKYQRVNDIETGKVKKISAEVAKAIVGVYPQFNITWLLTGEGEMLKQDGNNVVQHIHDNTNGTITGVNNGTVQTHGTDGELIKELAKQRELTEQALAQNDRLISIIEKLTEK